MLLAAFIFVIGLLLRMVLVLRAGAGYIDQLEPVHIALSLVRHGTFADAYGDGVGPTAHCMPLHPFIIAFIIREFGTGWAGSIALSAVSSTAVSLGFALLPILAARYGLGVITGFAAGLAGALLPIAFWVQTSGVFDAPFTFLGLIVLALVFSRSKMPSLRDAAVIGITSGIVCLLNAAVLQVLFGWAILTAWHLRHDLRRFCCVMAMTGTMVLLVLSPWAVRNYLTFGKFIWTRSNFGLELQVSNNPYATADLEKNVRTPAWSRLHPFSDKNEREKVRRMGEIAYQAGKKQQALTWISSHPAEFVKLTMNRVFLFWFPRMQRPGQTLVQAIMTALAFCGLLILPRRHPFKLLTGLMLLTYPVVYYLIQVSGRYRFPVEFLFLLLGAHFLVTRRPVAALLEPVSRLLEWSRPEPAAIAQLHRRLREPM